MESEAPLPVASLKPPLNPHDAKTVAKQLCYRIPESKDSLYFILRGLGLPLTGELGTTPRVEVDAKEYPTLWRALDCLGVPHDGKLMVIKAESPSLDVLCEKKGDRLRGVRPSSARRGSHGKPSAEPFFPPEHLVRSAPSSRPLSAHASSGYPAAIREATVSHPKSTQTVTASNAVLRCLRRRSIPLVQHVSSIPPRNPSSRPPEPRSSLSASPNPWATWAM